MNKLIHKIYASREKHQFSNQDIIEMVKKAQDKNKTLEITGMLLYENGSFFQILEGTEDVVEDLFKKISEDERHTNIVEVISEYIHKRSFEEWSMGYAILSKEEIAKIDGMNDFFVDGNCLAEISKGRAKKLLKGFQNGKWRINS
jgi:RecJ-like exonuclease